jgi:hypothetical protein
MAMPIIDQNLWVQRSTICFSKSFGIRVGWTMKDVGENMGAGYGLFDWSSALDYFQWLQSPDNTWSDHIFNTSLLIANRKSIFRNSTNDQCLLFFQRAGVFHGYERYRVNRLQAKGDQMTLSKINTLGATRITSMPLMFMTAKKIHEWILLQIDKQTALS